MTHNELLEYHGQLCDRLKEITKAKNSDYAGGEDAFGNFSNVEKLGITDTETGFLTRMTDKFSRIITFVRKGVLKVKDESIEDTLIDFANYCLLMACYIKDKKRDDYDPMAA